MRTRSDIKAWLTDMDGVLVHDNRALPGAQELIDHWVATGTPFLVLTNNATFTPRDLSARLKDSGLNVPEERIWTSGMATAKFLAEQKPGGTCFMVGEAGLSTALHDAGMVLSDRAPDFVVIGDTRNRAGVSFPLSRKARSPRSPRIGTGWKTFTRRSGWASPSDIQP